MAETTHFEADYDFGPAIFDLKRTDYIRIATWYNLYQKILPLHGDIWVFGVGWGRDMLIASHLRRLFEPNYPRRVIGFDTFEGVPGEDITEADGPKAVDGYNDSPPNWKDGALRPRLEQANAGHPSSDDTGFVLVEGRVQDTLPEYLEKDQAAVALAYIDYTILDPTKVTMELIEPRLLKGSVVAFNQFNTPFWSPEARALWETWGARFGRLYRDPYHRYGGHLEVE